MRRRRGEARRLGSEIKTGKAREEGCESQSRVEADTEGSGGRRFWQKGAETTRDGLDAIPASLEALPSVCLLFSLDFRLIDNHCVQLGLSLSLKGWDSPAFHLSDCCAL